MNKNVTSFNIHIRAALGHLLDACTKTLNTATPRNVSINIIYRTFHILEIRVWVSTEGVFVLFFHFTYRQACLPFTQTTRVEMSCAYT